MPPPTGPRDLNQQTIYSTGSATSSFKKGGSSQFTGPAWAAPPRREEWGLLGPRLLGRGPPVPHGDELLGREAWESDGLVRKILRHPT